MLFSLLINGITVSGCLRQKPRTHPQCLPLSYCLPFPTAHPVAPIFPPIHPSPHHPLPSLNFSTSSLTGLAVFTLVPLKPTLCTGTRRIFIFFFFFQFSSLIFFMKILCFQGSFNFTAKLKVQQFPKDPPVPEMHSHRWYIYYQHPPPLDGTFTIIGKSLCVSCSGVSVLFMTPWTVAHQAPLSMGFPRQEYWSGLPFPPPGDLPNPGIEPESPSLQADSSPTEPPENPPYVGISLPPGVHSLQHLAHSLCCSFYGFGL